MYLICDEVDQLLIMLYKDGALQGFHRCQWYNKKNYHVQCRYMYNWNIVKSGQRSLQDKILRGPNQKVTSPTRHLDYMYM